MQRCQESLGSCHVRLWLSWPLGRLFTPEMVTRSTTCRLGPLWQESLAQRQAADVQRWQSLPDPAQPGGVAPESQPAPTDTLGRSQNECFS